MSIINNGLLLASQAAATGGYTVSRSLRFNAADSAFLSRTPGSAGNRKTWTWSGWVKKSGFGLTQPLFNAHSSGSLRFRIFFTPSETLAIDSDATAGINLITTQVFRDPSAWLHLLVAMDTTQATAANRCKVYVNGAEITTFGTSSYPVLNAEFSINSTVVAHQIGAETINSVYFSGYLANVEFVDGSALTPASFGETDTNGEWQPKAYTGSYGTNGFRLTFSDNSGTTATTLGKDAAGSNNWTPNNFSVAAGAGNDSLVDTPVSSGTDTGVGGEVRGNYCTWNPTDNIRSGTTLSNGNLDITISTGDYFGARGTMSVSSGKWYWEIVGASVLDIGIDSATNPVRTAFSPGGSATGYMYRWTGQKYNNGNVTSYGASFTSGDIIGVALDLDAGTLVFYKNGTSQGTAFTGISGTFTPAVGDGDNTVGPSTSANFGQRPFAYTAPSGFKALCDTNLPTPVVAKPSTVFDTKLYTGTGSSRSITGLGFSPDLVWIKPRNVSDYHILYDQIRGTQKQLYSNITDGEQTETQGLTAFNSDGFTLGGAHTVRGQTNDLNNTYAAWCWDAGSSTVTNTQGSITSTVRANASAGFSVATWTGSGSGSATVGHGLGVAPQFFIVKDRSNARNWLVYHIGMGATRGMQLNLTTAQSGTDAGYWNNTAPTSTVATIGTYGNESANYVGYFWTPVAGYSSFGTYTANFNSDGPFIYLGFKPALFITKKINSTSHWNIQDCRRPGYNVTNESLFANDPQSTNYGGLSESYFRNDFLSNGVKIRNTGDDHNNSGATYLYCAWAENPFQYARAR